MVRRIGLISLLLLALFPFYSFADTARAGFPVSSIWLSTTAPLSGQEVTVYAVVYNGTTSKLEGTLTFSVDTKALSSMAVALSPGTSQIYSSKWTAAEGTHTFSAQLSGTTVSDVTKDAGTASVTVAPPPPPSAVQQTVSQTTNVVNNIASTSMPIISKVKDVVYNTTENWREQALAAAQKGAGVTGSVLGTSTVKSFPVLGAQKKIGLMTSFYSFLIVIFASRIYFYLALLILILIILWLLMKWVNKPRF